MSISGIYSITNITNGRQYIGSAVNIQKRWGQHRSDLNKSKHHSSYLQNAWNKHGADCFEFLIIEECPIILLIFREQYYINELRPAYNMQLIADSPLGIKRTKETRAKMSIAAMGNKRTLGLIHTPETREKISKAKMGNVICRESRDKISAANRINMLGNKHLLGHKHTPETRAKMSASHKNMTQETKNKMSVAQKIRFARDRSSDK